MPAITTPEAIEQVIKQYGTGADLYAGFVNQQNANHWYQRRADCDAASAQHPCGPPSYMARKAHGCWACGQCISMALRG